MATSALAEHAAGSCGLDLILEVQQRAVEVSLEGRGLEPVERLGDLAESLVAELSELVLHFLLGLGGFICHSGRLPAQQTEGVEPRFEEPVHLAELGRKKRVDVGAVARPDTVLGRAATAERLDKIEDAQS